MEATSTPLRRAFLGLWDGTIADGWFKWAGWLLITSALYALGAAAKSQVVVYMSYFSAALTLLYAMDKFDAVVAAVRPSVEVRPFLVKLAALPFVGFVIYAVPLALSKALEAAFVLGKSCQ